MIGFLSKPLGSRLLSYSPNPNHHDLVLHHGCSRSMLFVIPSLPHSICSLHGWNFLQRRLPSRESFLSRHPNAASVRLHPRRRFSSSSDLHPWPSGGIGRTSSVVRLTKAGTENRLGAKVLAVVDWLLPPAVPSAANLAAMAINWRPQSATAMDWRLRSAVVGAGRRRWLFWAWASHNRMWTSAGMPWLARVSAWAAKAFGLAVLKVDWPDGGISIGYYYPIFLINLI